MRFPLTTLAVSVALIAGCSSQGVQTVAQPSQLELAVQQVPAPVAKKEPYALNNHGERRIDNYYWMRDDERKDPEILAHLEKENQYTDSVLKHTEQLQEKLFQEIKGRIAKDDSSVPVREGSYFYSNEVSGDNEYPIYQRAKDFSGTDKTVILDVNELAKEHEFFSTGGLYVSPNENLLAYGEDTLSRRIYTIRVKDLATGEYLKDEVEGASSGVAWQNDNQAFYYIKKDPQTLLGYQVYRHVLGTPQISDELIYQEDDSAYYMSLGKSKDGEQVYIFHSSTETSGVSVIDANDPKAKAEPFYPREEGIEYSIAKLNDWYFIYTNYQAVNFRLMKVHKDQMHDRSKWQDVIAADDKTQLVDFTLFEDHLVYEQRKDGLTTVKVRQLSTGKEFPLAFNDTAFAAYMTGNRELDNSKVRIYYSSLTTPGTYYDFDLKSGESEIMKQTPVLGDFDADNYQSERIMITARDGKKVPVSLVYRKDKFKKDGTNPIYQYGYGSYGHTIDPTFGSARLSLLDRGFVYVIAHIRGSEMLGRPWYEDGKKLTKQNTFNDFIDVTKGLTEAGYGAKDKVFAVGGSAGGLLMGAVINQAPELYRGIGAHVPFVDVVTTMLDESIPLTTNEYDEWGNPNDKPYYDYMLSYSPYDNVKAQSYPNMLVTTGLHDSQVQYFEPMKWVAKLRELKTDDHVLLFKTDMEAGHGGASGRFKRLREDALEYAFFLDLLNEE
ncbi:S9 family peptidase [Vibrio coralliilyticus]|uniref:S9 family peptidase n=1 Tax=Vibrio coralliilyticus TaxID=190893 RepID=UPI000BAC2477|nr:S9 family peptidase [Vibrio coralliilyticus]NOI75097.1 S9 family peptidase [Vibrio coralliilyticus]PAW00630.1 oligopeptidase B [Vibrio coralliilyticus]